jgi:hypothetical protein
MFGNWGKLPMAVVKGIIVTLVVPIGYIMIKSMIDGVAATTLQSGANILTELDGYQVALFTSLIPIGYILASILWVFSDFIFPKPPDQL